jgi:hypothetical protein
VTRSFAGRQRHARLVAASAGIVAVVAAGALAGCGAGQIAETSTIVSAVPGGSSSVAVPTEANPNGALLIKNVTVDFNDINGYPAGATAPLSMWIINQSTDPVTVTAGDAQLIDPTKATTLTPLGSMSLSGGTPVVDDVQGVAGNPSTAPAAPPSSPASGAPSSPSESSAPAAPVAASVTIQPGTMLVLSTSAGSDVQHLEVADLKEAVVPGNTVQLTFNVTKQDGTPVQSTQIVAPVSPPSAPGPRVTDSGFPPSPSATS